MVKTATINNEIWLNLSSVAVMSLTPILNKFSMSTLTPLQASFLNALFQPLLLIQLDLWQVSKKLTEG
ncbi:putative integral membrane protein DUF6 [Fructobacillus tropaeoli]|uniref:Putative integral membrane protein DUF6 n=1 Tax=Fructobacillus tropaeoli TaxID=709323 RepID=A0A3F3HCD3_9LACO|nr:putative integral membrane protein DUF6 [Fructobacillus tropaeoli]